MKNVLILGATSDIAVAIAQEFAANGYHLILAARDKAKLLPLQQDLQIRYKTDVEAVHFEATAFESHGRFLKSLEVVPAVTICVFGYLGNQELAQQDWQETENIIHANYTGAVSILNHVARHYEGQNSGCIVGISSVAGERGRQSNYIYGSAKAGFSAYLSGLRNRLQKSRVHVVTVKPGFVDTKMTEGLNLPKPLTAQPAQVAKAVFKAVEKQKDVIYVLPVWRLIMLAIRNIPEGIFKKMKL